MATTINVILADSTTAITVSTGARGPAGAGNNSITSATTSDGTAALYLDSIRFETTNGGPTQTGQMAWESNDGSIDAMLESGVIVAMGEDLVIRVRNATASPIAKGAALAYDGTVGASGRIDVKPWVGSNIASAKLFLGFAAAAMDANGDGYSQWFGKLSGIDTDGGAENWQDEQIIYAVPGTSSTITNVAPTSGEYGAVAVVVNAGSGTSGILFVRPTFERATYPPSAHTHVTADITDATSDGQTNPGKVLKTNSLDGSLNVGSLSCSGLGIISETASAALSIANLTDDYTYDFPDVGGIIMVGANNLSEISSASTARTNLGLGTGDSPTFTKVYASRLGASSTDVVKIFTDAIQLETGKRFEAATDGSGTIGGIAKRFANVYAIDLTASGTVTAADLALTEKSADPADPAEGKSVIWQSDGTGAGDDGDIMIKITAGGVTKTGTIIDFSTL